LPATFLGVMGSAQGAGSIASGLVAGRLVTRAGPVPIAAAGTLLNAAGLLVRCVPWWPALLISAALIGAGLPLALIAALTATQTESPAALRGRVAATANTVIFGPVALTTPLGSLALGLGARPVLLLAAAACVVAVVAFRRRGPVSRPGAAVVGLGNRAREAGPDIELRESE
jgi:MFS family permease